MGKQEKVYQVFQDISSEYDRMNELISLGRHKHWKTALLRRVCLEKPVSVLDLCCGTGDIALSIAESLPETRVSGLDFSENMLSVARERLRKTDLTRVEFLQGNAMELPFPDECFDCGTISFGLRNVESYQKVVSEFFRVLRPGGLVLCLEASYPESRLVRPFFRLYFKYCMPLMGRIFAHSPEEYQWLHDSTEAFLTKEELCRLFSESGFTETGYRSFLMGSAALHWGRKGFQAGDNMV